MLILLSLSNNKFNLHFERNSRRWSFACAVITLVASSLFVSNFFLGGKNILSYLALGCCVLSFIDLMGMVKRCKNSKSLEVLTETYKPTQRPAERGGTLSGAPQSDHDSRSPHSVTQTSSTDPTSDMGAPRTKIEQPSLSADFSHEDFLCPIYKPAHINPEVYTKREAECAGNPVLLFQLACQYDKGRNGLERDTAEAIRLYRRASEGGHAQAMLHLASCYNSGYGVTKDKSEAFKLTQKAARTGDPAAIVSLAICYSQGDGVEKDYIKALKLNMLIVPPSIALTEHGQIEILQIQEALRADPTLI